MANAFLIQIWHHDHLYPWFLPLPSSAPHPNFIGPPSQPSPPAGLDPGTKNTTLSNRYDVVAASSFLTSPPTPPCHISIGNLCHEFGKAKKGARFSFAINPEHFPNDLILPVHTRTAFCYGTNERNRNSSPQISIQTSILIVSKYNIHAHSTHIDSLCQHRGLTLQLVPPSEVNPMWSTFIIIVVIPLIFHMQSTTSWLCVMCCS